MFEPKNQLVYHEIGLLQKFNDILGKVLKPKKNQPPTSEKEMRSFNIFFYFLIRHNQHN